VIASDIRTDRRWVDFREVALDHGLGSCWSTPILDVERGVVLGTFAVYHQEPWTPEAGAADLVLRLTHVAGVAIGTAALHGELVESEARFRRTFESTGVGIALVGGDGSVHQANEALARMVEGPVSGRSLADILHPDDARDVQAAMSRALCDNAGERLPAAEVRIMVGGSDRLWAALSGSLIRAQQGRQGYFCIELFDLTERRRMAKERHERAAAEAADRAKSDLLALVSHELRTPLTAVIGFAQLLDRRELAPDQQREGITHILDAGHHVLRLINDLIDLTGAETGQLRLTLEPVSLSESVEEATEMLAGLASEGRIDLHLDVPATARWVMADRHRLRQVLLNLVGNGIKFTSPGGTVAVSVGPGSIIVSDTGPGIAPDQIEHLFTPFHRAGDTGAEGSGLGLALSQRLTVAMGGDLSVSSEPGQGTSVRVELPSAAARGDAAKGDGLTIPRTGRAPRGEILYVEDDPVSQQLFVSALACWPDVTVDVADTLAGARESLSASAPDVLVLDVELPDGNGWELLRALSEEGATQASGVVVVTAGNGVPPKDLKPVEVLGKPLLIDALLETIGRRLVSHAQT
ncbi:MAG: ATP-binding protein, partial [Nocardioides sp.]|nr:ATP-binding protein [Nocardioides sp.]